MTDIFDQATEREMTDRDLAIKAALQRIEAGKLQPRGTCHNCDDPVPAERLFCDADCSADHELRMRAKRY